MVSHEDRKKQRLSVMIDALKGGMSKEAVTADAMIEWGMSNRTIREYIKVIEVKYGKFD